MNNILFFLCLFSLIFITISCDSEALYTCSANFLDENGQPIGSTPEIQENVPIAEINDWCETYPQSFQTIGTQTIVAENCECEEQ